MAAKASPAKDGPFRGYVAGDLIRDSAGRADCIIFDCDGVLVDVSRSYYRAIQDTVAYMLAEMPSPSMSGVRARDVASRRTIEKFKDTGMFNDEVDVACALVLSAAASSALGREYCLTVNQIVENAGAGGVDSVIAYVRGAADVSEAVDLMGHPSPDRTGLLRDVFDRMFYGPGLYPKIRGGDADYGYTRRGGIEFDNVIVTERVLSALSERFGPRMAMVTGRGLEAARYTLEPYLRWFDVKNSAFLEDEPRAHAKPNPARLDECILNMGCKRAVYVGDSVEDAMMAERASSDVVFIGIAGTSSSPERRRDLLAERGAAMVLESVLDIPGALNLGGS